MIRAFQFPADYKPLRGGKAPCPVEVHTVGKLIRAAAEGNTELADKLAVQINATFGWKERDRR